MDDFEETEEEEEEETEEGRGVRSDLRRVATKIKPIAPYAMLFSVAFLSVHWMMVSVMLVLFGMASQNERKRRRGNRKERRVYSQKRAERSVALRVNVVRVFVRGSNETRRGERRRRIAEDVAKSNSKDADEKQFYGVGGCV